MALPNCRRVYDMKTELSGKLFLGSSPQNEATSQFCREALFREAGKQTGKQFLGSREAAVSKCSLLDFIQKKMLPDQAESGKCSRWNAGLRVLPDRLLPDSRTTFRKAVRVSVMGIGTKSQSSTSRPKKWFPALEPHGA